MYLVLAYASDMDAYRVIVAGGLGLISMLGGYNGVGSVLLYLILWPLLTTYLLWIVKLLQTLKVNESLKKRVVLIFILTSISGFWWVMYVFRVRILSGLSSIMRLGVYVFVMLAIRVCSLLAIYVVLGFFVNLNYKLMILGLLPIPVFFVKICRNWIVIYYIMMFSYINIM